MKQLSASLSTDAGMQIDAREEQHQNANVLITETFEPDSNMAVARREQRLKQYRRSAVTDDGMEMNVNDVQSAKQCREISESLESRSNETTEK
jgi:hypothetical protein